MKKILIWDKDENTRDSMSRIFKDMQDYEVIPYNGFGGADEAIANRPDFVLLDVDYTVADVEVVSRKLAQNGITVIGLSSRWDGTKRSQYEQLFRGILIKSFDSSLFLEVVNKAVNRTADEKCELITFFSAKGKAGRTTTLLNFAFSLARRKEQSDVIVVDADNVFSDVSTFLKLSPKSTIAEAIRDIEHLDRNSVLNYCEKVGKNMYVLCGPSSYKNNYYITGDNIRSLIKILKQRFRYIVVDISCYFTPVTAEVCDNADYIYIIEKSSGLDNGENINKLLDIFKVMDDWQSRTKLVLVRSTKEAAMGMADRFGISALHICNAYIDCINAANTGTMVYQDGRNQDYIRCIDAVTDDVTGG